MFVYDDGVYKADGRTKVLQIAQTKLQSYYSPARCNDVVKYIELKTSIDRKLFNANWKIINLLNGLYDIKGGILKDHTSDFLSTIRIPVRYIPNAKCPRIEKFLSEVVKPEFVDVLIEWAGYNLVATTRYEKSVILHGEGRNGKGVYLNLLNVLIGPENTSSASLDQITNDKFIAAELYGKLANISAETPDKNLQNHKGFNALVSGDLITAQRKNQDPFQYRNFAKLTFSANKMPENKMADFAFFRRLMLIEFPYRFCAEPKDTSEKPIDKHLIDKLTTPEELSGFLNLSLDKFITVFKKGDFSYNMSEEDVKRLYIKHSNSVKAFCDDCVMISDDNEPV